MSLRIVPPLAAAASDGGSVLAAPSLPVGLSGELAPTAAAPAATPAHPDARKAAAPPHNVRPSAAPALPGPETQLTVAYVEPSKFKKTASAAKPRQPKPELRSTNLQDYGERLVKLIPSEVVGIYLVGVGVIPPTGKIPVTVWAVVCLGLVVLARAYATKEPALNLPPQWKAVLISSISFVIWVYTIPGPFQSFGLAVPYVGSLAILVWTFVVPYFYTGA